MILMHLLEADIPTLVHQVALAGSNLHDTANLALGIQSVPVHKGFGSADMLGSAMNVAIYAINGGSSVA